MSIQPRFLAHKLANTSTVATIASTAPHTIDLYLDYVCPFSGKMFNTVYNNLLPAIAEIYPPGTFTFVFRQVVQPWHPVSTLVHETAIAVERLAPEKFWEFSNALFKVANTYYDTAVYDEPRSKTYERLAKLAAESVGVDEAKVFELLAIPPSSDGSPHNTGNAVTNDLKLFVRQARQNSVHVTPTVSVNGIVNDSISSGWTVEKWLELLKTVYEAN
ncbi:thioredoxin-like protein [Limtongia smithiae]|uniref:thioredoxin-like protein n=1 Tax=Limtongia smithiae TaxID=1125753 RepID=UPI0034CF7743